MVTGRKPLKSVGIFMLKFMQYFLYLLVLAPRRNGHGQISVCCKYSYSFHNSHRKITQEFITSLGVLSWAGWIFPSFQLWQCTCLYVWLQNAPLEGSRVLSSLEFDIYFLISFLFLYKCFLCHFLLHQYRAFLFSF